MYSWDDSLEDWARPGGYRFDSARASARARDASAAAVAGPRTYGSSGPDEAVVTPRKKISSTAKTPLVIAVDVTGSMAEWPAEIFDRLPLLYNTLSQYRPDLEICFAAIGDAGFDRWPLQCTRFTRGFSLESELKAIYGEGGGGDEPESYGLFAWWMNTHVTIPATLEERPFLIVFGDATMHPKVRRDEVKRVIGDGLQQDADSIAAWKDLGRTWNTWFLRRKGRASDAVQKQWAQAVGSQKIIQIEDEQRAVDYAMGLIARHWGCLDDFQDNMRARQSDDKVTRLISSLRAVPTRLTA
jgi:hypothetical protein